MGVGVGVLVAVAVGVLVGVLVGVFVGVLVGVSVGVLVGVFVAVLVGVWVGVLIGVSVGVGVSGCAPASREETKNRAATRASAAAMVTASGHTPCARTDILCSSCRRCA